MSNGNYILAEEMLREDGQVIQPWALYLVDEVGIWS